MIYHLLSKERLEEIDDIYRPNSLEEEGFIHFCEKGQIESVLEFEEESKENLVVLCVNEEEVENDLQYENGFPHLYRELEFEEISQVKEIPEVLD